MLFTHLQNDVKIAEGLDTQGTPDELQVDKKHQPGPATTPLVLNDPKRGGDGSAWTIESEPKPHLYWDSERNDQARRLVRGSSCCSLFASNDQLASVRCCDNSTAAGELITVTSAQLKHDEFYCPGTLITSRIHGHYLTA
eukprot:CAMPEP_0172600264 /NCGR_PEP_ID=MMETSP1068-20121228/20418_1 /TAXON_ID=35684 /ORGANISM="Pseudopedinella elastica, Strain CCMP716" /LENGTH=139 /DNA_ID=CAMNT_0013400841 /DNA_START=153 /DNA_END=572 /DNA_ORIENTATION=-